MGNPSAIRPLELLYWRVRKGYTLADLAKRTGLSTATLHRIEHDLREITARTRVLLEDGLRLSAKELDALLAPVGKQAKTSKRTLATKPLRRLQLQRIRAGLSLEALAVRAKTSASTVFKIEQGHIVPNKNTLQRIRKVLKRSRE